MGYKKTLEQVRRSFWWPGMADDVSRYVSACDSCQRMKGQPGKSQGLLKPLRIPSASWESVGMDFIVHLPKTRNGHTAIVVWVDRLTKMVHFEPTYTSVTAEEVARLFLNTVFKLHGMPLEVVSDRDSRFTSRQGILGRGS